LFETRSGEWQALSDSSPVLPGPAFSYISRSFKQTTPFIIGALRLLALSYPPNILNNIGWSLYLDFRPEVDGWGKRSQVKCDTILQLKHKDNRISLDDDVPEGDQQSAPTIKTENEASGVSSLSLNGSKSKEGE